MAGRVIIVTGANSGIGFEAAKVLCDGGNEVILACRNKEKGRAAVGSILKVNPNAKATYMQLDLSNLASVRQFVDDFHQSGRKLNVLVNNGGVFFKAQERYVSKDNFELTMATNHLGHFLLTSLLLEDLKLSANETGDSRIVIVTSELHGGLLKNNVLPALDLDDIFLSQPGKYTPFLAYKNSKLANIMFGYELAKQLEGSRVAVNSVSPGFIPSTELVRHTSFLKRIYFRYILDGVLRFRNITRSTAQGAASIVDLAIDEKLKGVTGKYYSDNVEARSSEESHNRELSQKMWELSARYCHLEGYEPLEVLPVPVEEAKPENEFYHVPLPSGGEPMPTGTQTQDKQEGKKDNAEIKDEGESQNKAKAKDDGSTEVMDANKGKVDVKDADEGHADVQDVGECHVVVKDVGEGHANVNDASEGHAKVKDAGEVKDADEGHADVQDVGEEHAEVKDAGEDHTKVNDAGEGHTQITDGRTGH